MSRTLELLDQPEPEPELTFTVGESNRVHQVSVDHESESVSVVIKN